MLDKKSPIDGPTVENVGHSHAMSDNFFQMLNHPVEMLDHPAGKPKGMSNDSFKMLDKRYRFLNVLQKMLNISPWLLNRPVAKKNKMSDIPVGC